MFKMFSFKNAFDVNDVFCGLAQLILKWNLPHPDRDPYFFLKKDLFHAFL